MYYGVLCWFAAGLCVFVGTVVGVRKIGEELPVKKTMAKGRNGCKLQCESCKEVP